MKFLLILIVAALDQLTKWWALHAQTPVEVFPILNIVLVMNKGVSFGLFSAAQAPVALIALTGALAAALFVWMLRTQERLTPFALALVVGGAAANIVDRARFGAVVDFIDFHVGEWHWPAFNVADSAIVLGAFLLAGQSFFAPSAAGEFAKKKSSE